MDDEYDYGDYGYDDNSNPDYAEDYGDYGDDDYGMDEEPSYDDKMYLERRETSEISAMRNFKHELLDPKTLKSNLESKVKSLAILCADFKLDTAEFWNALRKNQFSVMNSQGIKLFLIDFFTTLLESFFIDLLGIF